MLIRRSVLTVQFSGEEINGYRAFVCHELGGGGSGHRGHRCRLQQEEDSTSESSTTATSSSTSAEATSSEESATEETSAPAEPTDYGTLLLPPADMGADTQTPGGVQLNPGGNPGAAQVYASPDGKQQIIDTILVFPDVAAADSNFQSNSATLNTVVTGPPEPVEIAPTA